jgi:hypothetical protein
MYYQIRRMVFETNSSSVHSLSLCNGSDYERWSKGELFYEPYGRGFVTLEEIINSEDFRETGLYQYIKDGFSLFKEMACAYGELSYYDDYWKIVDERGEELNDAIAEKIRDMEIYSIDSFFANTSYETFIESKNIDGVNVVAFGYFGHD